jgi:hypothetical protein
LPTESENEEHVQTEEFPVLVVELRDRIILEGIESAKKNETRPERIRGALAGFELCKTLETPEAFESLLLERLEVEHDLITRRVPLEDYWEHRVATAQVEFVWDRLRVAWNLGDVFSARAAIHVHEIVEGAVR